VNGKDVPEWLKGGLNYSFLFESHIPESSIS